MVLQFKLLHTKFVPSFCSLPKVFILPSAGHRWTAKDCKPPALYNDIYMSESERLLQPVPNGPTVPPIDRRRKMAQIRGPCFGKESQLLYGQFGVIALKGGLFKPGHFNLILTKVNRFIRNKPMFARWRMKAPFHPVTRHPLQAVMGGGKGSIDHYVTPVKARQVLFEIGGKAQFEEAHIVLRDIAMLLPVPAIAINKEMLEDMYEEEQLIEEENENFFTFRELVEKNMQGIRTKISMYDYKQFGKMR